VFEIITEFVDDAEVLVVAAIDIMAVVFVGMTWWRTRALATTLGSLLFGAVIVFGVNNIDILSDEVQEDVEQRGGTGRQTTDPRASAGN
jgi:hypothetical protein